MFGPALCTAYHVIYICCSIVLVGPQDKVSEFLQDHSMEGKMDSLVQLQTSARLLADFSGMNQELEKKPGSD